MVPSSLCKVSRKLNWINFELQLAVMSQSISHTFSKACWWYRHMSCNPSTSLDFFFFLPHFMLFPLNTWYFCKAAFTQYCLLFSKQFIWGQENTNESPNSFLISYGLLHMFVKMPVDCTKRPEESRKCLSSFRARFWLMILFPFGAVDILLGHVPFYW